MKLKGGIERGFISQTLWCSELSGGLTKMEGGRVPKLFFMVKGEQMMSAKQFEDKALKSWLSQNWSVSLGHVPKFFCIR